MKRVALALIAVLTLSGCSVASSLVDKAAIDVGLSNLTLALEDVDGVTGVTSTADLQTDYSYAISITATADSLGDAQLLQVATIASDTLSAKPFDGQQVYFAVEVPDGTLLNLGAYDVDLVPELAYVSAVSAAYGERMGVAFGPGTRTIFTLAAAESPDWQAMRALPDPSTLDTTWSLPGMWATGELPSDQTIDFIDALSTIAPPLHSTNPDDGPYFTVDVYATSVDVTFADDSYADLTSPASSPSWATLQQIAQYVAVAAGVAPNLSYGDGSSGAYVHFGACGLVTAGTDTEEALAAALGGGWVAGYCPQPV